MVILYSLAVIIGLPLVGFGLQFLSSLVVAMKMHFEKKKCPEQDLWVYERGKK